MSLKNLATCLAAVAMLGVFVGCAGTTGSNPYGGDSPVTSDLPPDTAVVKVEQTGGFVTPQTTFSRYPDLAIYADGRAITPGAQIMIYPPLALPSLQFSELSPAQLERILDTAEDAGLLTDDINYGEPGIADATTTVVTIVAGETTYVHEAYALIAAAPDVGAGAGAGAGGGESGGGSSGEGDSSGDGEVLLPGIDDAAAEARIALSTFIMDATMIAGEGEVSETSFWEPEAYSLRATPTVAASTDGTDGTDGTDASDGTDGTDEVPADDLGGDPLPWTIASIDLSSAAVCVPVEGDAAAQLRELLTPANMLTRFVQADTEYEVWIRPVFPDETACVVD